MSPVIYFTENSLYVESRRTVFYQDQNIMLGVTIKCFTDCGARLIKRITSGFFKDDCIIDVIKSSLSIFSSRLLVKLVISNEGPMSH